MTAAAYRVRVRRIRRLHRRNWRVSRRGGGSWQSVAVVTALAVAAFGGVAGHHAATTGHHAAGVRQPATTDAIKTTTSTTAAKAIAYVRAQLGKPYRWGGCGPAGCPAYGDPPSDGYDCSGLIYMAYQAAGVTIPRTSSAQWAGLPHITRSQLQPGDLVFFPGADGTFTSPGHVALVISKTEMIQAYGQGVPIEVSPLSGDGAGGIVGYARP